MQVNNLVSKRRPCSTQREAGICNVNMKLTREMEGEKTVTIERVGRRKDTLDYSRHTHDIEESLRYNYRLLQYCFTRIKCEELCL
jgi:hypothetical protein